MKITICWSMAFSKEFFEIKKKLEGLWNSVVIPEWAEEFLNKNVAPENKKDKIERNAIKNYFEKIKNSDVILVINKTKSWIQNYIWGNYFASTFL